MRQSLKEYLNYFKICKKVLFLTGTPIKTEISDIRWFVNLSANKNIVPYNIDLFNKKYRYIQLHEDIYEKIKPLLKILNLENVKLNDLNYYKQELMTAVDKLWYNYKSSYVFVDELAKKIIVDSLLNLGNTYALKYTVEKLDIERIDWGKYISYYKYDNLDYYPSSNITTKKIDYNKYQLNLLNRFYKKKSTPQDFVELQFYDSLEDAELFLGYPDGISKDILLNLRCIGNLDDNDNDVPKFKAILDDYLKYKTSTLIYSNFFKSGIMKFSKYLKNKKINHSIYHPDLTSEEQEEILKDFKDQKIKILLLHPKYYEGFSINGVRRFHILEPISEYSIKEQLFTRVIRFKSHTHLPKDQRNVEIILWYSTLNSILTKIQEIKLHVDNYDFDFSTISLRGGPDDIIINNISNNEIKLNQLSHSLKKISIENNDTLKSLNDTCCIYGDTCQNLPKCAD